MMKRYFLTIAAVLFGFALAGAQNVAYINTELILNEMPQYLAAQEELGRMAEKYKADIDSQMEKLDSMYKKYQSEKDTYSASVRREKENEIIAFERNVKKRQQTYFGEDGVMAKKSESMLSPIREVVQKMINAVAEHYHCSMVIDIAAVSGIIYTNPDYDITDEVKKCLKLNN